VYVLSANEYHGFVFVCGDFVHIIHTAVVRLLSLHGGIDDGCQLRVGGVSEPHGISQTHLARAEQTHLEVPIGCDAQPVARAAKV